MAASWPPPAIDHVTRTNDTDARNQHPKDHGDLEVAVNATLDVLGDNPQGEERDVTTRLGGLATRLTKLESGPDLTGRMSAVEQAIYDILHPYQAPAVQSFAMSGQAATVEVGTTVGGLKTFTWTLTNPDNVKPTATQIEQGGTVLAAGLPPTGSTPVQVANKQLTAAGSWSWTLRSTSVKESTFWGSFTVTWAYRAFMGTATTPTVAPAALGAGQLVTGSTGTFALAAGGFKYYAVPVALPAPTDFVDASTGLSITMADATDNPTYNTIANGLSFATVNVTNALGVTIPYRVYRSRYVLGGALSLRVV